MIIVIVRSLCWYVHLLFSMAGTVLKLPIWRKKQKTDAADADAYAYNVAKKFSVAQFVFSGSKLEIEGAAHVPEEGAVLFVANHQSNFDFAVLLGYVPRAKGFIAKVELAKIPVLVTWMRGIHCVFMDRTDMRQSAAAILEGIKKLKAGHCMVIFPEGTRSKDGTVAPFKAGSFKLATKAKVPIVPISLSGTAKIMEDNGGKIKPQTVRVVIHPPIPTADLAAEEVAALPERVHAIVANGVEAAPCECN